MSIRIGDAAFLRAGQPGVVREHHPVTREVKLETNFSAVQRDMRHGYLNGLDQSQRQALYEILDQVKNTTTDPAEQINLLRDKVSELEQNPQNHVLTRYAKAEMYHLMNTFEVKPRLFGVSEYKIRT